MEIWGHPPGNFTSGIESENDLGTINIWVTAFLGELELEFSSKPFSKYIPLINLLRSTFSNLTATVLLLKRNSSNSINSKF